MRSYEELMKAGQKEKQEMEAVLRNKEKFSNLSKQEKFDMVREYMFLQAKDEPDLQRRKNKEKATKDIYKYLTADMSYGVGIVQINPVVRMLDGLAKLSDGEFLLQELQSDMVKQISYGTPLRGGIPQDMFDSMNSYMNSLFEPKEFVEKRKEDIERKKVFQEAEEAVEHKEAENKKKQQEIEAKKRAAERREWEKRNREWLEKVAKQKAELDNLSELEKFQKDMPSNVFEVEKELAARKLEEEREQKRKEEEEKKRQAELKKLDRDKQLDEAKSKIHQDAKASVRKAKKDAAEKHQGIFELGSDFARMESAKFYEAIKKVDFVMAGKGSGQFREMKESLAQLKDYAHGKEFDPAKYLDKKKAAIEKVRAYLEYKHDQYVVDGIDTGRRDDPKKQKREQPRITTSAWLLETMSQSYVKGKAALIENVRDEAWNTISASLKSEEEIISKDTRLMPGEYLKGLRKRASLLSALNHANEVWQPIKPDGFDQSMEDYCKKVKDYTDQSQKPFENDGNTRVAAFFSKAMDSYKTTGKMLSSMELRAKMQDLGLEVIDEPRRDGMSGYRGNLELQELTKDLEMWKRDMYTEETKRQIQEAMAQPKENPVKRASVNKAERTSHMSLGI